MHSLPAAEFSPFYGIDKGAVLQEARVFNDPQIDPRRCQQVSIATPAASCQHCILRGLPADVLGSGLSEYGASFAWPAEGACCGLLFSRAVGHHQAALPSEPGGGVHKGAQLLLFSG